MPKILITISVSDARGQMFVRREVNPATTIPELREKLNLAATAAVDDAMGMVEGYNAVIASRRAANGDPEAAADA